MMRTLHLSLPIRRLGLLFAAALGLAGCAHPPGLTDGTSTGDTPLTVSEARGLFRLVCFSENKARALRFPFVQVSDQAWRHTDFDLAFSLRDGTCTMRVKPAETFADRRITQRMAQELGAMATDVTARVASDGYVYAIKGATA